MLCIAFIYKTLPVILRDLYKFVKYLIIFFELLNKKILSYKISNQQILHNGVFVKNFFKSLFKLSPIFLLASLMIISNISVLSEMTGIKLNILIIAPIATCYAFIVAMLTEKFKFADILDAAVANVKEMQIVFFILMLAYRCRCGYHQHQHESRTFCTNRCCYFAFDFKLPFCCNWKLVGNICCLCSDIFMANTYPRWQCFIITLCSCRRLLLRRQSRFDFRRNRSQLGNSQSRNN